ncbi:glycosyltransferase family 4 protein [Phycisphaerales bacterium AB-hyl4]|uniref:Glycosyltransferase family 4 protein n=1 Tax=Natronomicrosphaera hydrolytica TaxID=3242702 RepID=A0ABV4U7K0_9BACT
MKVLMTADTVGGVWVYAMELAGALKEEGVSVCLATMGGPMTAMQRRQVEALGLDVRESGYKLEWMDDPWSDVAEAGEWLLELERQVQPDVVHLNGYVHGSLAWRAPKLLVAHSCVVSWWRAVHGEDPPRTWNVYRERVRAGLLAADMVLAPTWAMLEAIEECYGSLPRMGRVANGRDPRRFVPGRKEAFAMAAGRWWDEAKNIRAVQSVADRVDWPMYVAGEGGLPATGGAAWPSLRPLGLLSEEAMADWLSRASVFVHPAKYEPFGLVVLEAAMSGCALVLGDIPSLREQWDEAALFVPPSDHDALQAAVVKLTTDDRLRRELARHACQRAMPLTPGRMATEYHRTYRLLAGHEAVAG